MSVTAVASLQTSERESEHFRAIRPMAIQESLTAIEQKSEEESITASELVSGIRASISLPSSLDRERVIGVAVLMASSSCANLLDPISGLRPVSFPGD